MTTNRPEDDALVYVVDDDETVRDSLASLLSAVGLRVESFGSAEGFLSSRPHDGPSCLVLDVRLPGMSGLNIQDELARISRRIPIIFVTGHADIPMTVRAMKAGAVEFLTKPYREQELVDAVQSALKQDGIRREAEEAQSALREAYATLTPREREILALVAEGLMNKQIAGRMGIAEITVKIHRGHLSRKLGARSVADLVRIAQRLGGTVD